jgi:hypothetical protein
MVRTSYIISGRDLRVRPRNPRPGEPIDPEHPENPGIPGPYPPEDGDYEDVGHPDNPIIPEPPRVPPAPGLYVGPTKGNPIVPVPPEPEEGEHIELPPGAIWPKARGRVSGHYVALAYIPEHGWRYIVIDPDAWPDHQEAEHPESPTVPEPATRAARPPSPGTGQTR